VRLSKINTVGCVAALIFVTILALSIFPLNSSAIELRPEIRVGDITFGSDVMTTGLSQSVFHQQTLASTDGEAAAVAFENDRPVPTITQASDQSVAATSTGFFQADLPFYPCLNNGASPVGIGQIGVPYPVTTADFSGSDIMFPEMTNQGNLLNDSKLVSMNSTRKTLPSPGSTATGNLQTLYDRQGINNSGLNAKDANMPVILSSQTFNFDAEPDQINNTSLVERLWRNSHVGKLMDNAYEGDTAGPNWIMPYQDPYDLMQMHCPGNVIKYSLEETKPGANLIRSFWEL